MTREELEKEVRKQAKKANQRMLRLERQFDKNVHGSSYAYHQAKMFLGEERNRFKENVKKVSYNDLQRELKFINIFNNSKSSTIGQIKKYTKARKNTLAERYLLSDEERASVKDAKDLQKLIRQKAKALDNEKLYEVLNNTEFKKMSEIYGSDFTVDYIVNNFDADLSIDDTISEMLDNLIYG